MKILSVRVNLTRSTFITRPNQQAFSLMELLLTLAMSTTLTVLAVPSFGTFLAKSKVSAQTSELQSALNLARAHAISNHSQVIVCAANDATMTACVDRPRRNTNWVFGWIVFADHNTNKRLDTHDVILNVGQNQNELGIVFNQNGLLRFFPDGHARSAGFYICDRGSDAEGYLRLLYTGRVRSSAKLDTSRREKCLASTIT